MFGLIKWVFGATWTLFKWFVLYPVIALIIYSSMK